MDSLRTTKISRLLQKELGELFRLETQKMRGMMISVTEVRVSPDLSIARVYLSIFPEDNSKAVIKAIQERAATVRFDLGKQVGSQLRKIPELIFHLDTSISYAERIDELLRQNPTSPVSEDEEQ
ncbi:30S ribosome-binding factor RbfA [Porphyromonas cangingivalis]|uniref:Ribosome-binding factor A n=1 Tax=Porphyromonas cangingivalis TaxID=36874 RepID=A0A0A2EU52_PORCN|nr:30S ribosome-binding factor RbfA [Porphyromonas cangingivalis]KGN82428.1 ribosome-binding factor A [Porphyromonas cangingivalis]SJZ40140.1 ribosome-binding factor A [Porphyromonas cangingivalis]SPY34614.1 ribosome-binding factor A [Porphyromonas cangingivalis]VEJ02806.1 ribosome-binding factor A [Porphyromonas cangingivalis]